MEREEDPGAALPEILKSLGFTRYEALVYIALLGMERATATEIHEDSGVPRASVYPVLDRLAEKNLVTVSHATPRRFSALPPEEGIENLLSRIEGDARRAKEILMEIYRKRETVERGEEELIWSIHGEEKISLRLRDLIGGARRKVQIFATWPFLEKVLLPGLLHLSPSTVVEVITGHWEGPVPPGVQVHVRTPVAGHARRPPMETAGIFIIDDEKAMVVMGISDQTPTALFSESPGFLRFFSQIWSMNLAWAAGPDQ
jgi:hypothetical protein